MAEHDGLPFAPVLVINLRAVFGRDHRHVRVSLCCGWESETRGLEQTKPPDPRAGEASTIAINIEFFYRAYRRHRGMPNHEAETSVHLRFMTSARQSMLASLNELGCRMRAQ
jgi:hypothetical protein